MFKLNIECTKDINELHINFADGSSVITSHRDSNMASTPRVSRADEPTQQAPQRSSRKEATLDLDADFGGVSQEVVKPPDINVITRPVKVASELQNLDI